MKRLNRTIFLLMAVMLILAGPIGCTKVKAFFGNNEAILQLATQAATARVLNEKPQWKQPAINITNAAMSAIDIGGATDLKSLSVLVHQQIDMSRLKPEERILVNIFIQQISAAIAEELKKQGVQNPAQQVVEMRKVLQWVNEAAKL